MPTPEDYPINKTSNHSARLLRARILIADELYLKNNSLYAVLLKMGCSLLYLARHKAEILKHMKSGYGSTEYQMDLLVLSATMPGIDVVEFCKRIIASEDGSIPVIILDDKQVDTDTDRERIDYYMHAGALDVFDRTSSVVDCVARIRLAISYRKEVKKRMEIESDLRDKLAQQKQLTLRREYLLNYDRLTQLASRQYFVSELNRYLGGTRNFINSGALLYLDINNFKVTNDIWGHEKGNEVLQAVAGLLVQISGNKNLVARLGSDEFAILVRDGDQKAARSFAEQIVSAIDQLVIGDKHSLISTSLCVGIVEIHPAMASTNVSDIFTFAHQACRIARQRGGDHIYLYDIHDPELKRMREIVKSVSVVRRGLREHWFQLFLQPIVRTTDRKLSHYEVLIRLKDDQGESYSPDDFIPAAEQAGLIRQIDYWVIENSMDLLEKISIFDNKVGISINLSAVGIQEEDVLSLIEDRLSKNLIDPQRVNIELTETAAITDMGKIRNAIVRLRSFGCQFALDDFGSGYCSFNYVKNFPVDYLKIDGMFIREINNDKMDQITVCSMVKIAHTLGIKVIAEFVVNEEIIDYLKEVGVDYLQGYCLGKPESSESILRNLSMYNDRSTGDHFQRLRLV